MTSTLLFVLIPVCVHTYDNKEAEESSDIR